MKMNNKAISGNEDETMASLPTVAFGPYRVSRLIVASAA